VWVRAGLIDQLIDWWYFGWQRINGSRSLCYPNKQKRSSCIMGVPKVRGRD
jgi:hypothetical protein